MSNLRQKLRQDRKDCWSRDYPTCNFKTKCVLWFYAIKNFITTGETIWYNPNPTKDFPSLKSKDE